MYLFKLEFCLVICPGVGLLCHMVALGLPRWLSGKEPMFYWQETQGMWVQSLGWEDPLDKGMATHSTILAWRIPWTEEPGGLQSMGSQRVGPD